jgi:hypothetical protein
VSSAADLIREAEAAGMLLEVDAGEVYASGALTETMLNRLRARKDELLPVLMAAKFGLTVTALREAAGPDWPEVERDPALLECLAHAVQTRRMRERGEVPAHYTATTTCTHCGPVPIFPGVPAHVLACPWCFNRVAGMPVPEIVHSITPTPRTAP